MPGPESFIFWLNTGCLGAQGLLQLGFSARVLGGRQRAWHAVLYLAALFLANAAAQKGYLAEARARYEQTSALRHDWQNHLTVLDGLLAGGRVKEGREYLQKLKASAAALSPSCRTGSPVVDILLSEKLGLAKAQGIAAEISLALPEKCGVDETDLAVLFANALDNALAACRAMAGERWIKVTGRRQGAFLALSFENTCAEGPTPPAGTGLGNIQAVARRYHGTALAEKSGGCFRLDVLLDLSRTGAGSPV